MEWENVQRDFIERTLKILQQYDTYVKNECEIKKDFEELEVTLLVNCLVGLLVFPYERATRDKTPGSVPICPNDTIAIKDLDTKWGLQNIDIEEICDFNHKTVKPSISASLRIFIYRMRNSISHSRFYDGTMLKLDGVGFIYQSTTYNPHKSRIENLVFQDINNRFKARISVKNLRQFTKTLATEVLKPNTVETT